MSSSDTKAPLAQIDENFVKLTLTIEPARFQEGLNAAYMKNRNKISMPGFRKGKAPRKMIEMQYGKEIFYEDALDFVFPDAYEAAVKEHNLDVVSQPSVDIEAADDGSAVVTVEVYTKPVVDIEDYSGITYVMPNSEVTDAEIDAELERERQKNARVITVTDRAVMDGDIAVIDFEGFVDGEAFSGGKGENFELTIGSKSFIDNFEDQIIGHITGDAFDVNVNFPEEYHASELAGKPAVFKIVLHEIRQRELPEINDDFAQEISEFDTIQELKGDIKKRIEDQKAQAADMEIENQVFTGLAGRIEANIPQPMIDSESNRLLRDFAERIQSQGMDFGRYMQMMGMDPSAMRGMYQEQAKQNVLSRLAIEAVVRKEGIEVNDEEYEQEINRLVELYKAPKDKFVESIGEDEGQAIREDLKAKKAFDMIRAVAVAVEAPAIENDAVEDLGEGEVVD